LLSLAIDLDELYQNDNRINLIGGTPEDFQTFIKWNNKSGCILWTNRRGLKLLIYCCSSCWVLSKWILIQFERFLKIRWSCRTYEASLDHISLIGLKGSTNWVEPIDTLEALFEIYPMIPPPYRGLGNILSFI
jgi:hypothetical protein